MTLVIDSSVAVKWFVQEPGHEAAKLLLLSEERLVAPGWAYAEVTNVLWRKVRSGQVTEEQARAAIAEYPKTVHLLASDETQMTAAFDLAQQLEHSIYDCAFLAVALQHDDGVLVTDDIAFARKAAASGYGEKLSGLRGVS